MKKILILATLFLGGCSTMSTLQHAMGTSVSPTEAIIAANTYDAIEATATGFLTFCAKVPSDSRCGAGNRRAIIKYVRSGRAARNQMESYIQNNTSVPSAIYNTVKAAVDNLKTTPAATFSGK